MAGNLSLVSKSGEQPYVEFNSFYENRLPLVVRVRDPHQQTASLAADERLVSTAWFRSASVSVTDAWTLFRSQNYFDGLDLDLDAQNFGLERSPGRNSVQFGPEGLVSLNVADT